MNVAKALRCLKQTKKENNTIHLHAVSYLTCVVCVEHDTVSIGILDVSGYSGG